MAHTARPLRGLALPAACRPRCTWGMARPGPGRGGAAWTSLVAAGCACRTGAAV